MPVTVALYMLAHGRSGDKGDAVNIGVIARRPEWYPLLERELTAERVAAFLSSIARGPVERFPMPNLDAVNFLVHGALGGGGSATLQLDAQGKTYAHALLRMPIRITAETHREAIAHWEGNPPPECRQFVEVQRDGRPGHGDAIAVERDGRLLHLTFNRPERRNALTLDMVRRLRAEIAAAAADPSVKVVLLSGAGDGYCAGLDLREIHEDFTYHSVKELALELSGCFADLLSLPHPLVAAVHGNALGGGTAMTLVADAVWAHEGARFGFPEVKIGFVPGLVCALALRRLPPSAAREAMLSGRRIHAAEAHRQGWAHHLVEGADPRAVVAAAKAYCHDMIRTNSADAMRRSKQLINTRELPGLLSEFRSVVELFASYTQEDSFREGVEAFFAKRPLDWSAE
jgi:methylglutaconyl-CoA hydratase